MRKKYDAFLRQHRLTDGEVPGLVAVVDDAGAGGITEAQNNLPQGVETAPVPKKIKQILYEVDGDNFQMQAEDFAELEEILLEDNDLQPKTYTISFMQNNVEIKIKNQRQFANFVNGEPNQGNVYRITITRADDKPKPLNQEERKAEKPSTDMPKPMPANQEESKVAKPSTDRDSIPYDQMTTHIRDRVIPYLKSIASKGTPGKCTSKHLIFLIGFRYKES